MFTELSIDSIKDELKRNVTSKSVILAPYNSNATSIISDYDKSINEIKDPIEFPAKVKDVDRQYEKNNNGDVDNGVYNKFVCSSSEGTNSKKSELIATISDNSLFNESYEDLKLLAEYRASQFPIVNPCDEKNKITISIINE